MYRVHALPTKPTKEATTEESHSKDAERANLHSVEDSLVLLQALRQSRQTWLTSAFVKFSTKSRGGKGSDIWQPPHTIRFRGKCDLEIGPHVFYATSVYEVTYHPYSTPVQAPQPYSVPSGSYTQPPSAPQANAAPTPGVVTPVYAPSTTALVSSLKGAVPITSELIAQVNTAATSNPTLANLLGLAASGTASSEQLQTLGVTIQSLAETALKSVNSSTLPQSGTSASTIPPKSQTTTASNHSVPPPSFTPPAAKPSGPSTSTQQPSVLSLRPQQAPPPNPIPGSLSVQQNPQVMQTIHKDPDVVIEFYENSYDRWTLPKDLVLYERVKRWDGNNSLADIIFSTIFPFDGSKPTSNNPPQAADSQPPKNIVHPITLRFFNVPSAIWNLFAQAAGDEERTKRIKAAFDSRLDKAAPRAYLQYRIPDGALLTQLQASASDRYPTKNIKPTTTGGTSQAKRRALKDGSVTPAPKRKRVTQPKKTDSKTGTCDICKRASIVLAPDSPYCPPCTKKVGATSTSTAVPGSSSSGVPPVASGDTQQATPTQVASTSSEPTVASPVPPPTDPSKPKPKRQRQPASSTVFKHSPLQTQYPVAARPPIANYYAWQAQPYAYHFQPHPTQSQPPVPGHPGQTLQTPTTVLSVQQPQPPPASTAKTPSAMTQKRSDLPAMD